MAIQGWNYIPLWPCTTLLPSPIILGRIVAAAVNHFHSISAVTKLVTTGLICCVRCQFGFLQISVELSQAAGMLNPLYMQTLSCKATVEAVQWLRLMAAPQVYFLHPDPALFWRSSESLLQHTVLCVTVLQYVYLLLLTNTNIHTGETLILYIVLTLNEDMVLYFARSIYRDALHKHMNISVKSYSTVWCKKQCPAITWTRILFTARLFCLLGTSDPDPHSKILSMTLTFETYQCSVSNMFSRTCCINSLQCSPPEPEKQNTISIPAWLTSHLLHQQRLE